MKQTYKGSCHCDNVQFEVDADLDHVRVCVCSICHRRGALIHRVEEKCFRLLTPIKALSLYQWHTKTAKDLQGESPSRALPWLIPPTRDLFAYLWPFINSR
jgi:hypothetical protein